MGNCRNKRVDLLKLLVSPKNLEEAQAALDGGADIIDVKNPAEGSLGANFPWIIREIVDLVKKLPDLETSATIGDVPYLPGMVSLTAIGLASLGVNYVKVGLYGPDTPRKVTQILKNLVRAIREVYPTVKIVAAGYADFYRLGTSINPLEIPSLAAKTGCDIVMVDTGIKDGTSLLQHMSWQDIEWFVKMAKDLGIGVALAGSLTAEDCKMLKKLEPDILGVRSAVCENFDRDTGAIQAELVRTLKISIYS